MFEDITPVMATIAVAIFGAFSWMSYNHQEEFKNVVAPLVSGIAMFFLVAEVIWWAGYFMAYYDFSFAYETESRSKVETIYAAAHKASYFRWKVELFFLFMISVLQILAWIGIVKKTPSPP